MHIRGRAREGDGKANPYRIEGPALISFSGGRTSAFMLRQILDAHDGTLPEDIRVAFANTGKEREETLRFVHECGTRWAVPIHWLEWRPSPKQVEGRPSLARHVRDRSDMIEPAGFVEVGYNSASRAGEPFAALIAMKQYPPNAVTRFCTIELKIRVMGWFCRSLGWEHWQNIVGLRYDEGARVLKALARNDAGKERWTTAMPMAKARHIKRDVMEFWSQQTFDLGLDPHEGNCDLCFLKSRAKLERIIRDNPTSPTWWVAQEEGAGKGRFVTEQSYRQLAEHVRRSPTLFDDENDEEYDVECGLHCAPMEAA